MLRALRNSWRLLVDTAVAPDRSEVAWINPRVRPGEKRKVITGIPGKTGIVYTLDRATGEAFSEDIGDDNPVAVYVPGHHAHGFEALTDCLFCYHVSEEYDPTDPDESTSPAGLSAADLVTLLATITTPLPARSASPPMAAS